VAGAYKHDQGFRSPPVPPAVTVICRFAQYAEHGAAAPKDTVPAAPVARIEVVRDTHLGETPNDPYRWMGKAKIPEGCVFEGSA